MYKFESQKEAVGFLERLGFPIASPGHIYIALHGNGDAAFVASNGELCLVDEGEPKLKEPHDRIKDALKNYRH